MTKHKLFLLTVLGTLLLSGCYMNHVVETSKMAVRTTDGRVTEVVGPGRYNGGFFADIFEVDVSAKSLEWEDPDLVTRDKQPISLKVGITFARQRASVRFMWENYNLEARDDAALALQVLQRVPGAAKDLTARYTLDQMLGIGEGAPGRTEVTELLSESLGPELEEVGIDLLNVTINNIGASPNYLQLLEEKANAQARTELSQQETLQLQEQLRQEKAQTEIDLEKARRQQEVSAELARTYEESERAYELRKLELMGNLLGEQDKVLFVPEGTDLTMLLGGEFIGLGK